jgi:ribonuclease T2
MRVFRLCALVLMLAAGLSGKPRAEDFDYYVLALSWSPSWCVAEGDARDAAQCEPGSGHGFVLHGLWPQTETGWPEYCRTDARDPSRRQTRAMADLHGSAGLALHQWRKHGRCTGLDAADYFALAREAHGRVRRPAALRRLTETVRIDPDVVEAAFLEANPWLSGDAVSVTCRDGRLQEVRICLTRSLEARPCSPSAERDCRRSLVELPPRR